MAEHPGSARRQQVFCGDEPGRSALNAISRCELFSALYLLAILNALGAMLIPLVHSETPGQALSELSNFSAVTVIATVVGVHLLRQSPDAPICRGDLLAAAGVVLLILIPHRAASWLAVTGLALFSLGRDRRSTTAVAAISVFLALAASSFWGPTLIQLFSSPLLAWDATLAAGLLEVTGQGVERTGNVIVTSGNVTLAVMLWCSFLPNLLYGFLCWTVIARGVRPAWRPSDLLALLAVGGLVLAANTLRLALMGLSADTYEFVHGWVGANAFNVGLLVSIAAIALRSAQPAASYLVR
jgi:Transmembrane exosortase (Exosortase_EpsH)